MRQNRLIAFLISLLILPTLPVQSVSAETIVNLPATPIAQRFSPADPSGDTGVHDCMAAAFATALTTLYETGNLSGERESYTYPKIRQLIRNWSPDITRGIPPGVLMAATPTVTKQEFSLQQQKIESVAWKAFLKQELASGRPVIVHIADRNALYNLPPRTDTSHVVVVYGMDEQTISFADSWDGVAHTVTHAQFTYAWAQGYYNWIAFSFVRT